MRYEQRHFRFGDSGPDVEELQRALNGRGYLLAADGELGPKTWEALQRYGLRAGHWNPRIPLWVSLELLELEGGELAKPKPMVTVESTATPTPPLELTSPKNG